MLKKYTSYLGVFILACFSFIYTDRAVDIVKRNDPIMKSIIADKSKYEIDAVSALVFEDEIIPGINGLTVDVNKSYSNMKKNNAYSSSLYVFEETMPSINLHNRYDKYIVSGNSEKMQVALIFKVGDVSYITELSNILLDKNAVATFFIDGNIIESSIDKITELSNNGYEIENFGYNGNYSLEQFVWTNNLIYSITKSNPKFCYVDYKNNDVLRLCANYNMHTIKPIINVNSYPFSTIKHELTSGNIISFDVNSEILKELPSIISDIRQKGYSLILLKDLISEKRMEE